MCSFYALFCTYGTRIPLLCFRESRSKFLSQKRAVCKYSLGMRQRMAIAQAIMEEPDILILDEPLNGLDKKGVREMRELFLQMKIERKTILLVSHNREDIDVLNDKVCEMEDDVLKVLLKHKITVTFRKKMSTNLYISNPEHD